MEIQSDDLIYLHTQDMYHWKFEYTPIFSKEKVKVPDILNLCEEETPLYKLVISKIVISKSLNIISTNAKTGKKCIKNIPDENIIITIDQLLNGDTLDKNIGFVLEYLPSLSPEKSNQLKLIIRRIIDDYVNIKYNSNYLKNVENLKRNIINDIERLCIKF